MVFLPKVNFSLFFIYTKKIYVANNWKKIILAEKRYWQKCVEEDHDFKKSSEACMRVASQG